MSTQTDQTIRHLASTIGIILEKEYPREKLGIPEAHVDAITDHINLVVADIIQAWIDAGSEREVTLEDLWEPMNNHIKGWVDPTGQ